MIKADEGGDIPEAVMDGLREGLMKTTWREIEGKPSKRILYHCCDAPPHGKKYGRSSKDSGWEINGCPCGTTVEHINKLLRFHHVKYSLFNAGATTDILKMK